MGERKGFQTYISPDFDPALVPKKSKKKGDVRIEVRLALPFSMSCTACNEFMYKGRKFNAKKETVTGETYLGLKIYRFYIKCTRCAAPITFKTDPKEGSYVCEKGSTRNFELFLEEKAEAQEKQEKEEAVQLDPIQALESKTAANQAELDAIDELEAERARRSRNDRLSSAPLDVLAALDTQRTISANIQAGLTDGLTAADEVELAQAVFASSNRAQRLDSDSDDDSDIYRPSKAVLAKSAAATTSNTASTSTTNTGVTLLRRKRESEVESNRSTKRAKGNSVSSPTPALGALSCLAAYGSGSESDSS
eukprot:GSChrysophyteH1.ASY1.ANO1.1004.1 assembled CDS